MQRGGLPAIALALAVIVLAGTAAAPDARAAPERARDLGVAVGVFPTGEYNAITDVQGVRVGHSTIIKGDDVRTGVTAIVPARPYKPKDKSKAEVGVQVVERWIMMRLRKQTFFTLAALNQAIRFLLEDLNQRPFKKRPGSRSSQFEQLDKPALKPLPDSPYQYRDIKKARVHLDYHIEYDQHFYSVPYQLVKQAVMVHAGQTSVAIMHQSKLVALHPRSFHKGGHTTDPNHMAKAHRKHQQWSPQRFLKWAAEIGPHTVTVVEHQLASRPHPEHGYRACLGLLNLAKKYSPQRLEAACQRAHRINAMTYKSINSILRNSLDKVPLEPSDADDQIALPLEHDNVRGADYYH